MRVAHRTQYFACGGGAIGGTAPGTDGPGTAYAPPDGYGAPARAGAYGGEGANPLGEGGVMGGERGDGAGAGAAGSGLTPS